jgi:hypothetical protein
MKADLKVRHVNAKADEKVRHVKAGSVRVGRTFRSA